MRNPEEGVTVVIVPLPIQGHMNQLLHLSRLLLSRGLPVHFVCSATHNRQARLRVQGWDPLSPTSTTKIHFHDLQIPKFPSLSPKPDSLNKFPSHLQPLFEASFHLREPVGKLLRFLASKARRLIVINDSLMGYVVQDIVSIPNGESYTFHSVSAFACFLYMWESMGKPIDANEIIPKDIPSSEGCFTSEFKDFIALQYKHKNFSHGTIYDCCKVIEGPYLDLLGKLEAKLWKNHNHWALGPFNPVTTSCYKESNPLRHHCLEWLDKQKPNSIIYISFGSTTSMSDEQIEEIALGLKRSNQKFIWVLRDADKADVFEKNKVRKVELPKGYEDSVKDIGIVIRDWAPQLDILAHASTGWFISHCGWNSCMESITMGVPIGAWPMHSDQPRNAVLVTKILNIGVVVKEWEKREGTVKASVVENAVKRMMGSREGEEMRNRAAELGDRVRRAVEEGGVSRLELDSFFAHINRSR